MNDQHDDDPSRRTPTSASDVPIDHEAMDWVVRMAEPDADWDGFMTWLEHDPARASRYDHAASALRDAEQLVATALRDAGPVPIDGPPPGALADGRSAFRPPPPRRVRWVGGALAAGLAGALSLGLWTQLPRPYEVETAAGDQRTIDLGDGSSVLVAGASKVRLDRHDARVATVERGEMLFRVRHDGGRPFTVTVGDLQLVDLGTVFDVKASKGLTRVAVAEGAVLVDPDGAALRLGPGQAMVARGGTLERRVVDAGDVGGWHRGRLAFDGASLAEVAADLSRQLGRRVTAAPAIAERTFHGTIDLRASGRDPALLGRLLGVKVSATAGGWVLEAGD